MRPSQRLLLMLLLTSMPIKSMQVLCRIVGELNAALSTQTNIFFIPDKKTNILDSLNTDPVPRVLFSPSVAKSTIRLPLYERVLIIMHMDGICLRFIKRLHIDFQFSDLLVITTKSTKHDMLVRYSEQLFELGYLNVLHYNMPNDEFYAAQYFPRITLAATTINQYLGLRDRWTRNMQGHEVRVLTYHNPPRSLYNPERGFHGGYVVGVLREFLHHRNARFKPVYGSNPMTYSPNDCIDAIHSNAADTCADMLPKNAKNEIVGMIHLGSGKILVSNARALPKIYYILAPFCPQLWMILVAYIFLLSGYCSLICWRQQRRWRFNKFVLQLISSLLNTHYSLHDLRGPVRRVLFIFTFVPGFVLATLYLALLKSRLATGLYEPPINSFEALVKSNTTILFSKSDLQIASHFGFPDELWPIIQVINYETLLQLRINLDTRFAYVVYNDRQHLIQYQQRFLLKPIMRFISDNAIRLFGGFAVRPQWFLRKQLNTYCLNIASSGVLSQAQRLADYKSVQEGFLHFMITQYYKAKPLDLDYYKMPSICLLLGYLISLILGLFMTSNTAMKLPDDTLCKCISTTPTTANNQDQLQVTRCIHVRASQPYRNSFIFRPSPALIVDFMFSARL
ncbi:uncharacterized protein LOC115624878 [Scaptodrosophila lebanonensis]|uniref:Uncharacterized protein LOC115624878 n=1 Tax=Drosophila lebanonensis TaxID=7225 RepID=A0A6J2TKB0_DROLE|nr:uncharacterized protein LOC115624878 [Scaptodrosophila lebanonensis]